MKKFVIWGLLMAGMTFTFIGCDKAKDAAKDAANKATDLANVDFGDFDMTGLQDKFKGITDGFEGVSADNVDGLASKITGLTGALDGMGIDKLTGPAKTAAGGVMGKFVDSIKGLMGGISDEGILSKLKPVVDALMEKIKAFM